MTWLVVVLSLAALVFLHELGHFTVARLVGMKPRAFYIGFPPALSAGDFDAARASLPALRTVLGQALLSPSARRSAEQAVRDVFSNDVGATRH
jgi:hypothetical protein